MHFKENATYISISILIILFMLSTKPQHHVKPVGVYLPQTKSLPQSKHVTLYQRNPGSYKPLGYIYAQFHTDAANTNAPDAITRYAERQAKANGANGLIINFIGHNENHNYPDLSGYEIIATAINRAN